ncbi:hypothetical protein, partial [Pseudobutyrivibrio sp.]
MLIINIEKLKSRRPSGLRKTRPDNNSLAHRTTWLRSDFKAPAKDLPKISDLENHIQSSLLIINIEKL